MPLVIDASIIISLAFPDEDKQTSVALIEAIAANFAVVPALFWFEIRNALVVGERRKRVDSHQTKMFLAELALLHSRSTPSRAKPACLASRATTS